MHFHPLPSTYNVTKVALDSGFDLPMEIASLKVTRYVRHFDFPSGNDKHERVCPLNGGVLVHEYNAETTAALTAIGGQTPERPAAMIKQATASGEIITLWDNGRQH